MAIDVSSRFSDNFDLKD